MHARPTLCVFSERYEFEMWDMQVDGYGTCLPKVSTWLFYANVMLFNSIWVWFCFWRGWNLDLLQTDIKKLSPRHRLHFLQMFCSYRNYPYFPHGKDFFLRTTSKFQSSFNRFFECFVLTEAPTLQEVRIFSGIAHYCILNTHFLTTFHLICDYNSFKISLTNWFIGWLGQQHNHFPPLKGQLIMQGYVVYWSMWDHVYYEKHLTDSIDKEHYLRSWLVLQSCLYCSHLEEEES